MVRAKFKVIEKAERADGLVIKMQPVYPQDGNSEDASFFKYTPFGEISMGLVSEETGNKFIVGKKYYVDFTLVE